MTVYVAVKTAQISISNLVKKVESADCGAIDIFVGAVRNSHNGKDVVGITYDAHENLAEKVLRDICCEGQGVWPGTHYAVEHYKGELPVGGISVAIAVSSPHRAESFEACRYVIEEIKRRLPIWKKEHYVDGKSEWLPGHSLRVESELSVTCCGKCCNGKHG
ncbi:molybdenum cofactor biosynthesis protein MoaE [Micavibrio aeruginosavorus]|uniref:molybdenum cofactor biosynthesis protein MoaE n=1 Tax=Micavibrio aeruginosavorus TaxID=349221 RepID=UPI00130ED172|nr:molybdenum cofactor biosynthesis protein MoaE [Micavibrio aeruginosavorus]